MNEKKYSMIPEKKESKPKKKKVPGSKQPIYSDEDQSKSQLMKRLEKLDVTSEEYCTYFRNHCDSFQLFIFSSLILSLNMFKALDSENVNEYWAEGSDVLLSSNYLDQWAEEEQNNMYEYRRKRTIQNDDGSPKLGIYICKPSGWAKFLGAERSQSFDPYTLKLEDIDQERIKERMKKALYLKLENILLFQPLTCFEFPHNIQFLSIEQSTTESYTGYPETSWQELFNNCVFPGVKFLRIRISQEYSYRKKEDKKEMPIDELERKILEALLNKEALPNLQHLALSGFTFNSVKTVLMKQRDFLSSQLISFELTFDGDSRDHKNWSDWTSFTCSLSHKSKTLRRVVVETDLDCRYRFNHTHMEKFYSSHNCVASIGHASISRFYYICNE